MDTLILNLQQGTWSAEKVVDVPDKKVENWLLPDMPGKTSWERKPLLLYFRQQEG